MALGAGRAVKGAPVDHAVGLVLQRKVGDRVEAGEPLATVHARGEVPVERVPACFEIGEQAPRPRRWCWGGSMPELPEVETVRRGLERRAGGPRDRPRRASTTAG